MMLLKKEKEEEAKEEKEEKEKKIKNFDFSLFKDISIIVYMCSSELQNNFCMLRLQAQKSYGTLRLTYRGLDNIYIILKFQRFLI